jgi:DNA-binding NarL/FixJ family response regulator
MSDKRMISFVVVEDDVEIQHWIQMVASKSEKLDLQAVYSDAESFLASISELNPDVYLLDIHLPGMNGIACLESLKKHQPKALAMMFTVFEEDHYVFDALCAGASGYQLKNTTPDEFVKAIEELHNGGSPMSSLIARKVISSFHRKQSNSELARLSTREQELLRYLSLGYRYKEIADILHISIETVRTHIRNIYEKLQVQSRTEALNKVYPRT